MPFIDLLAQSLRGDERVIAAIRRTRALARLMALERRAFINAVKRHLGVAETVAREARETFRCAMRGRGTRRRWRRRAMTDARPVFSIYERHIPIEFARVAAFFNPIGGEILRQPSDGRPHGRSGGRPQQNRRRM